VIREAVEEVDRWIGGADRQAGGRGRGRTGRRTEGTSRGGTLLENETYQGKRGGEAREGWGSKEDSWERRATRGSPQEASTTTYQSKLAWALQWLPDDDPHRP
jgi:hypothetical protein